MLDKNTSEWLNSREKLLELGYDYFCPYCENYLEPNEPCECQSECDFNYYLSYKEEAEYEARVARCVAVGSKYTFTDLFGDDKERLISVITHLTPAEMALMAARIQVEEENNYEWVYAKGR